MFGYTLAGVVGQLLLSADESEHMVRLGRLQWALGKAGFNMMLTGSTSFATTALLSLVRSRQRVSVLNNGMSFIAGSCLPSRAHWQSLTRNTRQGSWRTAQGVRCLSRGGRL